MIYEIKKIFSKLKKKKSLKSKENTNKLSDIKTIKLKRREKTLIAVTLMVMILFFSGYSIGKGINTTNIKTSAEVAKPILVVENNPAIDIRSIKETKKYDFKIKNYNDKEEITDVDLRYTIEILSNKNDIVSFKIYKDDKELILKDNKTEELLLSKDVKQEDNYKLEIIFDNTKINNIEEIIQDVQIKVHSEQA